MLVEWSIPERDGFADVQGAVIIGIHGIGVSVPSFAAVAAATTGFDKVTQFPNGFMFNIGTKSVMCATGSPDAKIVPGATNIVDGVVPNAHLHVAPLTTIGIFLDSNRRLQEEYTAISYVTQSRCAKRRRAGQSPVAAIQSITLLVFLLLVFSATV